MYPMRRKYSALFSLLLLPILLFGILFFHIHPTQAVKDEASNDHIIVKYKAGVTETEKIKSRKDLGVSLDKKIDKIHAEIVKVPPGKVDDLVQKYKSQANVEYAEPDFVAKK